MVDLQIDLPRTPTLDGGVLCPACARSHGRSIDGVYPLMYLADITGQLPYLDAAIRLLDWGQCVSHPNGSWRNEPTCSFPWKGTTVFATIALGEALRLHGHILDDATRRAWEDRLLRAAEFVAETFDYSTAVINYPLSAPAALASAGLALDDADFVQQAQLRATQLTEYLSEPNHLIFGEGKPWKSVSARGCRPIDLGYNVEETLPNLVLYAHIAQDPETMDLAARSFRSHLEFMLPDGAWDNSFGTRSFKWTYWGSRTSDGCQLAAGILADRDPIFEEMGRRNLEMLERCTHDGLLHGGPHYHLAGYPPCVHHTFCHAKALAAVLDHNGRGYEPAQRRPLPRENSVGVRNFAEAGTRLVSTGRWRATLRASDWTGGPGYQTGNGLVMLYHLDAGPLCAAGMTDYAPREPSNMQIHSEEAPCLTPRLELLESGRRFSNLYDPTCTIEDAATTPGSLRTAIGGDLYSLDGSQPDSGTVGYRLGLELSDELARISVTWEGKAERNCPMLVFPLICSDEDDAVRLEENLVRLVKPTGELEVHTSGPADLIAQPRLFNLVPGFQFVQISLPVTRKGAWVELRFNRR
ncbi:MAG: hypothetical protein ACLFVU_05110 [Phycisphaerae bacterium]